MVSTRKSPHTVSWFLLDYGTRNTEFIRSLSTVDAVEVEGGWFSSIDQVSHWCVRVALDELLDEE